MGSSTIKKAARLTLGGAILSGAHRYLVQKPKEAAKDAANAANAEAQKQAKQAELAEKQRLLEESNLSVKKQKEKARRKTIFAGDAEQSTYKKTLG